MSRQAYFQEKALYLKQVFYVLKEAVFEADIEFDTNGVFLKAKDPENISMIEIKLLALDFYECETPLRLGIFTSALYKSIRQADPEDVIEFAVYRGTQDLTISIVKQQFSITTTLQGHDPSSTSVHVVEPDYDYEVTLETRTLQRMIKEIAQFSQRVKIHAENDDTDYIRLSSCDDFPGSVSLSTMPIGWASIHTSKSFSQEFFVKYIERFLKAHISQDTSLLISVTPAMLVLRKAIPRLGTIALFLAGMEPY